MEQLRKEVSELVRNFIKDPSIDIKSKEAKTWLKDCSQLKSITKLPGDASTRRYYRVVADGKSYVLMKAGRFLEDDYPFLEVGRQLSDCAIDVPRPLVVNGRLGFILLEDLGDITLLHRLQTVTDINVERHYYERAIDELVKMQISATKSAKREKLSVLQLHFDFEKLMWEINFAVEHFYKKVQQRRIKPQDKSILTEGFGKICRYLAKQPEVFTHRDFHSRNIMIVPGKEGAERIVFIDFQDARMGPKQYDLVSLLKDSYYQLEPSQVHRLVDYYIARWEAASSKRLDRDEFFRVFDYMSVQRNFKAIGSFASFLNRRQNATYLKYIGNTFENIRRTLLRLPEFSELREVLFYYYYF